VVSLKSRFEHILSEYRMLVFLSSLLLWLISFPIIHEWYSHYLGIIETFFSLLLIAGAYVISRNPQILTIASLIALLGTTIMWFDVIIKSMPLLITGLFLQVLFLGLTAYTIIHYVMSYQKVNADTIYGAISVYLLLGIMWAMAYTTLELAMPESFSFSQNFSNTNIMIAGHQFYFSQFMYYSFVTLTTLGYGDILPITLEARGLASLEAVVGQLYIAVLVARLVGLHISHTHWEQIKQEKKLK
jgi:hypothetical protein